MRRLWRWHWERTGLVDVKRVDALPEGGALWLQWKKARKAAGDVSPGLDSDIQVLEADQAGIWALSVRWRSKDEDPEIRSILEVTRHTA